MNHLDPYVEKILQKHCSCLKVENRILLETISVCPECQTLFTTVIYDIPQDRMREVLEALTDLMNRLGIPSQGMHIETGLEHHHRHEEEAASGE